MAILQRSCGCCGCDVKTGSIVVAVIWIILSLIGLGYNARLASTNSQPVPANVALLAIYVLSVITHILLIIGVVQKSRPLVLTWVIVTIICTVATLAIYIYVTVVDVAVIAGIVAKGQRVIGGDFVINALKFGITLIWIYWAALFIMTVYGCLVVISHYQNLHDAALGQGQPQMVAMGNQPYMVGNQPYMVGNQPNMIGNQPYKIGNELQPNMGNQPTVIGNQPNMMGNQPALVGNQPTAINQPKGTSNPLYK